ncbi:MAG: ABC transporter permease subunit, partial [Moorea sp. SIO4A1]|uniref:PstC family ABC transporter permease n=1 Tax=Moorena sp. SIO4A1 TaxID=2607835 RepID=UPI00144F3B01
DLPWKLYIPPLQRPPGFQNFDYFHPTFLYESVWNLLVFGLLSALTVDATLAEMNQVYWQGAASLGLSRWGTILGIMLPAARLGVFTGIILGIGRALGETMLVLMVCGNVPQIPDTLFAPIRTLPANIALEMAFALGNHRSSLFVTGLLLLAVSLFLALLAEAIAEEKHIY